MDEKKDESVLIHTDLLPLPSILRKKDGKGGERAIRFINLVARLDALVNHRWLPENKESIQFKVDHTCLFGRIPKRIFNVSSVKKMTAQQLILLLGTRTHWFNRLSHDIKGFIKTNLYTNYKQGLRKLREVLNCVAGTVTSFLLGVPELCSYEFLDKVTNSIISNCYNNYSFYTKHVKDYKKSAKKAFFSGDPIWPTPDRSLGYYEPVMKSIWTQSRSKSGVYKICTVTQSRAWGLGDTTMAKSSIDKFVGLVTKPDGKSPDWFQPALSQIARSIKPATCHFALSRTKIVLSSHACRESTRADGGKNSYISKLLMRYRVTGVPQIDLSTGVITEGFIPLSEFGTAVFHAALHECRDISNNIFDVTLSVVRENAKCRTVTSSSGAHAEALQPLSHFLLDLLEGFDTTESGVSASRHLWRFYRSLDRDSGNNLQFDAFESRKTIGLSWDLETATDFGQFCITRDVINIICTITGVPVWYREFCIKLLTTPRRVWYNGAIICTTQRGQLMGDPVTKAILSFAGLAAYRMALNINPTGLSACRLVGDDGVILTTNKEIGIQTLKFISELGYKISEQDTFYSNFAVFFTEEAMMVPVSRYESFSFIRSNREAAEFLPYVDFPKVRLLIDTHQDDEIFSSTSVGKYNQMGHEVNYVTGIPAIWWIYQYACCIQAINIPPSRLEIFPYLPKILGGAGLFPPGYQFLIDFLDRFRAGKFRRHIISILNLVDQILIGKIPPEDFPFRPSVTQKVHSIGDEWLATYPPYISDDFKPMITTHSIRSDPYTRVVASRLVSSGELITSSSLAMLSRADKVIEFICTWDGTGDFNSLLERINRPESFLDVKIPVFDKYTLEQFSRFQLDWQKPAESVLRGLLVEDLFHYSAERKLFESQRVTILPYQVLPPRPSRESSGLYDWLIRYKADPSVGPPPSQFVTDDPLILKEALEAKESVILIVTDDTKLCKLVYEKTGKLVIRMPMMTWSCAMIAEEDPEEVFRKLARSAVWRDLPYHYLFDSGSLLSFEERNFFEGRLAGPIKVEPNWFFPHDSEFYPPGHHQVRNLISKVEVARSYYKVIDISTDYRISIS